MKRKVGRPALDDEDKRSASIVVRTWPMLKTIIEDIAAEKGVSLSRYVEDLLIEKAKMEGRWS